MLFWLQERERLARANRGEEDGTNHVEKAAAGLQVQSLLSCAKGLLHTPETVVSRHLPVVTCCSQTLANARPTPCHPTHGTPCQTPCPPHAHPMPTSCQPYANLTPTLCQPHANPMPCQRYAMPAVWHANPMPTSCNANPMLSCCCHSATHACRLMQNTSAIPASLSHLERSAHTEFPINLAVCQTSCYYY